MDGPYIKPAGVAHALISRKFLHEPKSSNPVGNALHDLADVLTISATESVIPTLTERHSFIGYLGLF